MRNLRIGLVINPIAGVGGPAGLKGSDGVTEQAYLRGSNPKIEKQVERVLSKMSPYMQQIQLFTVKGNMGQNVCTKLGWQVDLIDLDVPSVSSAKHTSDSVSILQTLNLDLIVFAGGDGTARDVFDVLDKDQTVLGIPGGVKMHSGVFANNPESAGEIICSMARGDLVGVMQAEVRDIDETAFRKGIVKSAFYGECWVPEELQHIQAVKMGGMVVDEIVLEEIAACIVETMEAQTFYLMGSGTTLERVMAQLDLENTLLGVDVIQNKKIILADAYESQLFELISKFGEEQAVKIVITVIGGQGHIFGRGNQQLSPRILRKIGLENIIIVASEAKLNNVQNTLRVDTGDPELDQILAGYRRVITGFETSVLCQVVC